MCVHLTSLEKRKEARYQRRKAAREKKKQARYCENDDFNNIIRYQSLCRANRKSMRNVSWKESTQRYQMNLLRNMETTRAGLEAQKNVSKGFVEFDLIERGRRRHIRSVHFSERVVQRSLCDNALVPMLRRGLIYDNGACLPGKGVDRSLNRLTAHLQQFYRANGFCNDGYVVLFDFSAYFDNIRHEICFQKFRREFSDKKLLWLIESFVRPFGFPAQNTGATRRKSDSSYAKYTGMSLGLGSEVSQVIAVAYPNALDWYIKQDLHVRWYGRYMDDGYLLFREKEEAKNAIQKVSQYASRLGIRINEKKTKIVKLSRGFKFLKTYHLLTETGKVIRKLSRESITRQRRKLKKFACMVKRGKMEKADACTAYGSWKGYALSRGGRMTVYNMDLLFCSLFHIPAPTCKLQK